MRYRHRHHRHISLQSCYNPAGTRSAQPLIRWAKHLQLLVRRSFPSFFSDYLASCSSPCWPESEAHTCELHVTSNDFWTLFVFAGYIFSLYRGRYTSTSCFYRDTFFSCNEYICCIWLALKNWTDFQSCCFE
jgi:hypothetical protein